MLSKVKCSQCKYLKKGMDRESFISPQGIPTTVHHGRFYCAADISKRFSDEQIKELRECFDFRPRKLDWVSETKQKILVFIKNILKRINIRI